MYILWEEKEKETISSSLQTCFVVAHSSGDLNRTDLYHGFYIQYDLIYAVRNLTVSCCVGGLCFCGGRKTRVHYVCSVLIVRVGR